MTQAEAGQLFGRPKEELSNGLGQEARDQCTGEGHQIIDMLTSGPHLCIWVCLRRSKLAQRQGDGSNDFPRKKLVGGQANEPSSCSESYLLEALPQPGTLEPAVAPG